MHIGLLPFTLDVAPLVSQLAEHPELWDAFPVRTESPLSPHREMSDIIVRYNDRANYGGDRLRFNDQHEAIWYPLAGKIPAVYELVAELRAALGDTTELGMVLITRLPAGKQCYPHHDDGWHAQHYEKFAVQLASTPEQAFCFEGEELSALPGQSYWFDNSFTHWVTNNSHQDRMTLIASIRRTPCQ